MPVQFCGRANRDVRLRGGAIGRFFHGISPVAGGPLVAAPDRPLPVAANSCVRRSHRCTIDQKSVSVTQLSCQTDGKAASNSCASWCYRDLGRLSLSIRNSHRLRRRHSRTFRHAISAVPYTAPPAKYGPNALLNPQIGWQRKSSNTLSYLLYPSRNLSST